MKYYLRFVIFSIGMMVGIHLPAMTSHYEQSVLTKLDRLKPEITRLQRKANTDFYGSIDSLTEFYLASDNSRLLETGQRADAIKHDYDVLQKKAELFSTNFLMSLFEHARHDYQQTYDGMVDGYHWQPRLTPLATLVGLMMALIVCVVFELILLILSPLTRSKADKPMRVRTRRRTSDGRHF